MKINISCLMAAAILCSCISTTSITANAMEAATYEEMISQRNEIIEFPDPDLKYRTVTDNNLEFRLYDEFAVLSESKDREVTEVEIPSEINGLPVVGSVGSPFGRCRNLKRIILPDTFEHFEWFDFVCTTVVSVTDSFTGAAQSGTIVSNTISSSKKASDSDVLIPSVAEVVISETNPYYTSVDGIVYSKDMKTLVGCPPAKEIKEIKIPEQTERINDYAFFGCINLENAVIPQNIEHINNGAFLACTNLKSIEFPGSIKTISGEMCYGCESLTDVVFNGKIEKIGYGAFGECHALEFFDIPDTVIYIGSYAFENCRCIKDIDGVYYVGNWVVGSSEDVETVDIKAGAVGIAEASFFTRSNMSYINVPSSVQYLGYMTFGQLSSSKSSARMDYRCAFIDEKTVAAAKTTTDFYIYDPECDIFDSEKTIPAKYRYTDYVETDKDYGTMIDGKFYDEVKVEEDTVLHGYKNSTAQAYAERYNRKFEPIEDGYVYGDINADGKFTVADVVMLQKWLLCVPDVTLANWKAADLCEDGVLNVFDLCMMKHELIGNTNNKPILTKAELRDIILSKEEYTWSDFEQYQSEDIGSGVYVLKYKVDFDGEDIEVNLYITGSDLEKKPEKIYIDVNRSGEEEKLDIYEFRQQLMDFIDSFNKQEMTMDDVIELSNKGDNLTWSDFDNYEHSEDVGSGLTIYEFKIANYSDRFTLVVGYSDENSLQYVRLKSSGSTIDITESSENDIMMFIAEHNPPA